MVIHKKTRLTPIQRKELSDDYFRNHIRICHLKEKYHVSAPTIYKILHRARDKDYFFEVFLFVDRGSTGA